MPSLSPSCTRRRLAVAASVAHPSLSRMAPGSLCHTTACARVPTFLGWMRAWGTSPRVALPSAPAWWLPLAPPVMLPGPLPYGFTVGPQCIRYAAGSEKEKRAGGPTSWGYYSTIVLILQWGGGITWTGGLVAASADGSADDLAWPAPSIGEGSDLACALHRRKDLIWRAPLWAPASAGGVVFTWV